MDDGDIGDPDRPGQFETRLQPTGDSEVVQDGPRLTVTLTCSRKERTIHGVTCNRRYYSMNVISSLINVFRQLVRHRKVRSEEQFLRDQANQHPGFRYRFELANATLYLSNAKGDIVSIAEERLQTISGEQSVRQFIEAGRV